MSLAPPPSGWQDHHPLQLPLGHPHLKDSRAGLREAWCSRPAEDVPTLCGHVFVEILLEAGIPPEVIQLVHGIGEEVGLPLVEHPDVPLISSPAPPTPGRVGGDMRPHAQRALSLEMGGRMPSSS